MKRPLHVPISKSTYGASALVQDAPADSGSRAYMFFTQSGNLVCVQDPDVPYILSGLEREFKDMNFHTKLDFKFRILSIMPYFDIYTDSEIAPLEQATFIDLIYHNIDDNTIGYTRITKYGKKDKKFGFTHKWNKIVRNMHADDVYSSAQFTTTNSEKDGVYAYGKNVNVLFTNRTEVAEDAFKISTEFVDMFELDLYKTFKTHSDSSNVLLNHWGDKDNYSQLPKVGQKIPFNGIVMVSRKINDDNFVGSCSLDDLSRIDYNHDKIFKVESMFAEVCDVTVVHNPDSKSSNLLTVAHDELLRYSEDKKYHDLLFIGKCKEFVEKMRCGVENELHVKLVQLQTLYHPKIKRLIKREAMPTFSIEVTVKYSRKANVGFKFTTKHGSKGVASYIVDKEDMPIDVNGLRVQLEIVSNSNIHRMNIGNVTEGYAGTAVQMLDKLLKSYVSNSAGSLKERVKSNLSLLVKDYGDFLEAVNPNQAVMFRSVSSDRHIGFFVHMMRTHCSVPIPIDVKDLDGKVMSRGKITRRIKNTRFAVKTGPVTLMSKGKVVGHTINHAHIHTLYMFALNKIADDGLVVASARLNPLAIPVSPPAGQKDGMVFNEKPTKISETETRFFASYTHPRVLAELRDRNLALITKYHIARQLLDASQPSNIDVIVDRKVIKFGGDVVLKTINGLTNSMGIGLKGVLRDIN